MTDIPFQFNSISSEVSGIYRDRGSKFHASVHPVKTLEEIEIVLAQISSDHPKARHICYAWRLGISGEPHRINDDGEPSGSAGRPIFNELLSADISNAIGVVVRYFGGTKLGVPGLIKAYKESIRNALTNAEFVIITLTKKVRISYQIEDMGRVYQLLKSRGITNIESNFQPEPHIIINVPINEIPTIRQTILAEFFGYKAEDIDDKFETDRLNVAILAS